MAGRLDQATQTAAIARITESATALAPAIREELQSLLSGAAFASSNRSQRFLTYVVENALDGKFDQLKERTIGVDLFGRAADYDTGEDAIVRVTATDVRKRLAEHYAAHPAAKVKIGLPQRSYIPEFAAVAESHDNAVPPAIAITRPFPVWQALCGILLLACAGLLWTQYRRSNTANAHAVGTPWSQLFRGDRRTYLVTSDTGFAALQDLMKKRIKLSDYAAHAYPPQDPDISPDQRAAMQLLSRNQFTSAADAGIAAELAGIAARAGGALTVMPARSMQIRSFRNSDNFILTGSSYANPWVELFADKVGFSVEYEPLHGKQICRDRRAIPGDPKEYVPTALTGGNGEACAVMSLLRTEGGGYALLLAGTNMEGTEAAADFAADTNRLATALAKHGISGDPQFEILLRLRSMAGSANSIEVAAVRRIP